MDLAIVIVNYNVCELLRKCLRSVYATEGEIEFSVCVVDNASDDGSVSMIETEFPKVQLIANSQNVGYPAANNQGLKLLGVEDSRRSHRPSYCLLLNPDTEIPNNAFSTLIEFLDSETDVGIVGPKLVLPDGSLDLACRRAFPTPIVSAYRMVGLSRMFPKSPRFGRYNMTYLSEDERAEVDSVVGAFMMVRTDAIVEAGLLDERFWMYGEDLDWAKRIKNTGWKVVYDPEVTVLHIKRASSRQNRRAQTEFYRAMLIFYYKHYHQETSLPMHWLVILGIIIRGGRSVVGDVFAGQNILEPIQI
jgi:GT2 family glycosyltransferase